MALVKWDPFRDVAELQNRINRMFDESFGRSRELDNEINLRAWRPAVDIYEADNGIVVAVELPGVNKENVAVEVKDDVLTLKGERLANPEIDAGRTKTVARRRCGLSSNRVKSFLCLLVLFVAIKVQQNL